MRSIDPARVDADRTLRRGLEPYVLFPLFALLLLIVIWTTTWHLIRVQREAVEQAAVESNRESIETYEARTLAALRGIDRTLRFVKYAYEVHKSRTPLSELEIAGLMPAALVFGVSIADRDGLVLASNRLNESSSVAGESYFEFHKNGGSDGLYVGRPDSGRIPQDSQLRFSRRLNAPDGSFAGVALVSVNPAYFTSAYERSRFGDEGVVGLVGSDGSLWVRRTGGQVTTGETLDYPQAFGGIDHDDSSPILRISPWDGVERYLSARQLNGFPLTAFAGLSQREQFESLAQTKRTYRGWATGATVLLVALAALLTLSSRQLAQNQARTRKAREIYHAASEASLDAFFVLRAVRAADGSITDFVLVDANSRGAILAGSSDEALLGKGLCDVFPECRANGALEALRNIVLTGVVYEREWQNRLPSVQAGWLHCQIVRVEDGVVAIVQDISERKRAEANVLQRNAELSELNVQLSQAHEQILQSEKLASIGQLAAGVAHEINNPISYVFSNFGTLQGFLKDAFAVLSAYEDVEVELSSTAAARIKALRQRVELDYLKDEIPTLLQESCEGLTRVRKIVQDLKDFSRVDSAQVWELADIHRGIDSTLNIIASEIKYRADVVKAYGTIPEIECLPTQINQVVMNLLVNAAHATGEKRGRITIRTGVKGDAVWIDIEDEGCGIPREVLPRIFDPFFTTKPVGKGTGLGLSLSYGIIQKHHGSIEAHSEVGKGTTFHIELPVRQAELEALAD